MRDYFVNAPVFNGNFFHTGIDFFNKYGVSAACGTKADSLSRQLIAELLCATGVY
jgi:hypothetical protein